MLIIKRLSTKCRNVDVNCFLSILFDTRGTLLSLNCHRNRYYNGRLNVCQRSLSSVASDIKSNDCKYKIAIIGSGPAGFYTSQQLLKVSVIYFRFRFNFELVSKFEY